MLEKVFLFSEEVAKENGVKIIKYGFGIIMLAVLIAMIVEIGLVILQFLLNLQNSELFGYIVAFLVSFFLVVWTIKMVISRNIELIAFARGIDGKIYMIKNMNTYSGVVNGNTIDPCYFRNRSFYTKMRILNGIIVQSHLLTNRTMQQMQSPKTIERLIRHAGVDRRVSVLNILKVDSYVVKDKYVKIRCDYMMLEKNKLKTNKTLKIYKCYTDFEELMNMLLAL